MAAAPVTIALTRPRGVDSSLAGRLAGAGYCTLDCAMTAIGEATPQELDHAAQLFHAADALVLVSPQAVKATLERLPDALHGKPVAVMGPGSRAALEQGAVAARDIIESATQDGLGVVDALLARLPAGACVAIGRARSGRDDLARALSARGLMVNFATLYHRTELAWPEALAQQLLQAASGDLRILFTTSSAPAEFAARVLAVDAACGAKLLQEATAHCTHPNVANAAAAAGFAHVITQMGDEAAWQASLQSVHV